MATRNKTTTPIETAEQVARKIWLAGLGAYGRSYEEIQNQYEKLNDETNRYFEELVAKGEKLESSTKKKIKKQASVEKGVEKVRKTFSRDTSDIDAKINELSAKVDALTVAVSKLTS